MGGAVYPAFTLSVKRNRGGHDCRRRLFDDSRSFLVPVAIGVAATGVKAATCERDKRLAHNGPFCSGSEEQHSSGAKRIEEPLSARCERLAVRF